MDDHQKNGSIDIDANTYNSPLTTKDKYEMQERGRKLLKQKPFYTWIIVLFVVAMIIWTYITYVVNFIIPWIFVLHRYYGIIFWIIFTVLTGLVSYSYYKCIATHPGIIPESWKLSDDVLYQLKQNETSKMRQLEDVINRISSNQDDVHHDSAEEDNIETPLQQFSQHTNILTENIIEKSRSGQIRVCQVCKHIKADRTHHCRQCGVCILKMDHHCWWFNNCIGFYNYKYFFLFLFWTVITTMFLTTTMANSFLDIFKLEGPNRGFRLSDVNIVANYFINFFFGFSLVFFALYHLKLVLSGQTTLESLEKYDKLMHMHHCHPYDLGVTKNWKAVFGEKWYWWFLPTYRSVQGDGIHFESCLQIRDLQQITTE